GIGAPEQALKRLNVDYDILFACDNGERNLEIDYDEEYKRVLSLNNPKDKEEYVKNLYDSRTRKKNYVEMTYKANYKCKYFFQDVKLLDGNDFKNKIDVLIGGSPCQSFSIVGKQGGFDDTRGTLFYEYARLVKETEPKIFIYENVYNVLSHDKGKTWATMQNVFNELGYHFSMAVLNAKDYGIPQTRKRVFVVGFKKEKYMANFKFPEPIELTKTVPDFLEDNYAIGTILSVDGELKPINNKKGKPDEYYYLTPGVLKYVLSPGTKGFYHPEAETDTPIAKALLSTMHNHHRTSVNNYITTNGRLRELTINEGLRLMGFPDDFVVVVSKAQMYKQIGNSIVVDVMMAIFNEIMEAIKQSGKDYK
ncbi:MAG: DNA (cytosine-5-)-methyltransferase, partial [Eubacterium sp.]|nr:DNA (cytosine-5-)-methyltransferase [Eubacterium sp.]